MKNQKPIKAGRRRTGRQEWQAEYRKAARRKVGLPVVNNCDACGVCCHGQEALPVGWYLGKLGDASALPASLHAELVAMAQRFDAEGWPGNGEPCVWYDAEAKRCKHHEYRPQVCRDFEVGGDVCLRRRREEGVDQVTRYKMRGGRIIR